MFHSLIDTIAGNHHGNKRMKREVECKEITGTVVLMKKNVLDFNDFTASLLDHVHELLERQVSFQLISSVHGDAENEFKGRLGKPAYLEHWDTVLPPLTAGDSVFKISFEWNEEIGIPGAFLIRNNHHSEFYLKSLTLEDIPGVGPVHFICNSWVYPAKRYKKDRIFFSNKTYLSHDTPAPLLKYREEELENLRGDGKGERHEWDRIYDYDCYNDLGTPDKGPKFARPILGGCSEYPYPRRGRTGRQITKTDPNCESRLNLLKSLDIYVPRDERFGHVKLSDFLAYGLKAISQVIKPELEDIFGHNPNEFDSFQEILKIYEDGIKIPQAKLETIRDSIPLEMLKEIFRTDGEGLMKFPVPQVIQEDRSAWRSDEEFAREMVAGLNPVIIRLLKEFPPPSKLDRRTYGDHTSSISKEHIEVNMDGVTVEEAIKGSKMFILDHYDWLMPYLTRINSSTSSKVYASRTLLYLKDEGTLKPVAIELSLPHPEGDQFGAINTVYIPAEQGVESSIWQLAKAYVAINDSGYHQLVSHWLNTHAVIEPFVIATHRQLSVLHPIHKLLHPHFRDTMFINAFARQTLTNAGGILEATVFPGKYALEMSSAVYKNWVFLDQALPADLVKRGVAIVDPDAPHGLRLLIEDYPYAVDGLEIWSAISSWVKEYCFFYYQADSAVKDDDELQSWWKELREEGHGDLKHEHWWPKMHTREDLIETCTTIIWIASALHAAINFGQYAYGGYLPNRPTISRRFMPEKGSPEYDELVEDPDKAFLRTVTPQLQTLIGVSLVEILSMHSTDEVYLGQRDTPHWASDTEPLKAFERFGKKLAEIEVKITNLNNDKRLKNRGGPVKLPYTLLYPSSKGGLTGKGIPNSVSI